MIHASNDRSMSPDDLELRSTYIQEILRPYYLSNTAMLPPKPLQEIVTLEARIEERILTSLDHSMFDWPYLHEQMLRLEAWRFVLVELFRVEDMAGRIDGSLARLWRMQTNLCLLERALADQHAIQTAPP